MRVLGTADPPCDALHAPGLHVGAVLVPCTALMTHMAQFMHCMLQHHHQAP